MHVKSHLFLNYSPKIFHKNTFENLSPDICEACNIEFFKKSKLNKEKPHMFTNRTKKR